MAQITNIQERNARTTLQGRLVLFMLAISLIPLIGLSIRSSLETRDALAKSAELSLISSAEQTANTLDTFIRNSKNSLQTEASISAFASYLSLQPNERSGSIEEKQALELMDLFAAKDVDNIIAYSLVNENGIVVLDTSRQTTGRNEFNEEQFTSALFTKLPVVTSVKYFGSTNKSMSFASPVLNRSGSVLGVLQVRYRSEILQKVIQESIGETSESYVLLLDQHRIRMADTTDPSLVLKSIYPLNIVDYLIAVDTNRFLDTSPEQQATNFVDLDDALEDELNFFQAEITPNTAGNDTIAIAFLEEQPWQVLYGRPTSVLLADVQEQIRINILLVAVISILVIIVATLLARALTRPITSLTKTANSLAQGNLDTRAEVTSNDEIGVLAGALNSMTDRLQGTLAELEQRIFERTADLQKRTSELETIANVAREISIIRDLDTLLNVAANLIRERMNYYHVGIFLLDANGENAVLQAASSVAADQMLENKYKIRTSQSNIIGNVVSTGLARIALDIGIDATVFDDPYLPNTRSQIVLPLINNNIVIGILDIHANVPNAFDERDIQTLETLTEQLSAAIENTQLVQQTENTLTELTRANRAQVQQVWQTAIAQKEAPSYEFDGLQVRSVPQGLSPELLSRLKTGSPIVYDEPVDDSGAQRKSLLVPLMVLNQIIGVIGLEQDDPSISWTEDDIAIAQAAANRAALTLENARLLDESLRRASKERTIFEATARIGSALNIENILQATAEELERILGDAEVIIQFEGAASNDEFEE